MKQVILSMIVVMLTAGIFAGMVLYTVSVMRQTQLQILEGEFAGVETGVAGDFYSLKAD